MCCWYLPPTHLTILELITPVVFGEKYIPWKLLIINFSSASCYFSPLRSKTQFSNTIIVCSSLHIMDQASRPYVTRGGIIILYMSGCPCLIENEKAKVLDLVVAGILQIYFILIFLACKCDLLVQFQNIWSFPHIQRSYSLCCDFAQHFVYETWTYTASSELVVCDQSS